MDLLISSRTPTTMNFSPIIVMVLPTVLLIVLNKAIKNYNFEIDEAHNGKECIEKINAGNTYDLIFLDILMPCAILLGSSVIITTSDASIAA